MRQRATISLILFFLSISMLAQSQQGYVKTLGRPNQKGVALSGVSVRVKGGHNAVLSNADGTFQMPMAGKKNGDAYQLQQVQKQGYELNEHGTIGRQYAFSDKVPLTIVMVSTSQLQADKQRIENNAYRVAQKNYKAKLALLDKQKENNIISIELYRQQLQDLQDKFEKYQSLIDDLADHYAHVDYDELDVKEQEINASIEQGNLERADSLLHLLGIQQRAEDIAQRIKAGQLLMDEAKRDQAVVLKQQEKDANYLYQLYTIALARFDNEKAIKYIVTRAEMDTANVEWQLNASSILKDMGLFKDAMKYNNRALLHAKKHNYLVGTVLNNIGDLYSEIDQYKDAIKYLEEAELWDIREYGKDNKVLITLYNNLGLAYEHMDDFLKAKEYYEKAYSLVLKFYPEGDKLTALLLNNLAGLNSKLDNKRQAVENLQHSLKLYRKLFGEECKEIAMVYLNLGDFFAVRDDSLALKYVQKSYNIYKKIFGEHHPDVARCYENMGAVYGHMEQSDLAISYLNKAYQIHKDFYGETHTNIAGLYYLFSILYQDLGQYEMAHDYNRKALDIYISLFGENHSKVATCYFGKAGIYLAQKKLDEAENVITKALTMRLQIFGSSHPDVAACYACLCTIYVGRNNPQEANKYIGKAISIMEQRYPEGHPSLHTYYMSQGACLIGIMTNHFMSTGVLKDDGAEDIFNKMLKNAETFFPNDAEKMQAAVNMLVSCYFAKFAIMKKISPEDTTYMDKLKALSKKYPQYVKKAIEELNTNGNTTH